MFTGVHLFDVHLSTLDFILNPQESNLQKFQLPQTKLTSQLLLLSLIEL